MKPKIYAREISDGISELIKNNSVACLSVAKEILDTNRRQAAFTSYASANPNQSDLFYLESILVSTGWNNNDDIFLPSVLWDARNTPKDKQFNYMHNEKDIIGHITGQYIMDFDNNVIPDDVSNIPDQFEIATAAVIYTSWSDPELADRMENLIAGIRNNEWYVSMECLFPEFDYMLKSEAGDEKIIYRNEATAHLSKFLRAYGGTGVYQGYKVGRILRNIVFSGKGLVNKPANPRSLIISTDSEAMNEPELVDSIASEILGESQKMTLEELQKLYDEAQAKIKENEATIASLTGFKSEAETLQTSNKDLLSQIATLTTDLENTKASLEASNKEKDEAIAKMNQMECEKKTAKRKASLVEVLEDEAEVNESLASMDSLSDEAFDKLVAAMKKMKCKVKPDSEKDKEEEVESKASEIEVEVVETEKSKASINEITQSTNTDLRASLSEWIKGNVLRNK